MNQDSIPTSQNHQTLLQHLRGKRHIVINACHGAFDLSDQALLRYCEFKKQTLYIEQDTKSSSIKHYWLVPPEDRVPILDSNTWQQLDASQKLQYTVRYENQTLKIDRISRDDPDLVRVVKELGNVSWGKYSKLKIVEIPCSVDWVIQEYDGLEWIAEKHRIWK